MQVEDKEAKRKESQDSDISTFQGVGKVKRTNAKLSTYDIASAKGIRSYAKNADGDPPSKYLPKPQRPINFDTDLRMEDGITAVLDVLDDPDAPVPADNQPPSPPPPSTPLVAVAQGSQPFRVILTETQRKQNHITSQKNRRDLNKELELELAQLVGGRDHPGLSRAETLEEAFNYIWHLKDGNKCWDLAGTLNRIRAPDAVHTTYTGIEAVSYSLECNRVDEVEEV